MEDRLNFNEWQVWIRIQLGYSLEIICVYSEALGVDMMKLVELARQGR